MTRSSSPEELRKLIEMPPAEGRDGEGRVMATYAFKAVDLSGIPQTGVIDGADKQSATTELKAKGLKVMALEEQKSGLQMELRLMPKRVKPADLTVMSRQLATMISSGMTLLRAFYVLEEQVENQLLRETIGAVREDIEAGLAFSDALERHPKVFNPLYVAMVRSGEAGGVLEESLERISDQLEKDDSLRRQVKSAMAYPIVVFTFAMAVLIGMIAFIVPVFVGVFKDFGGELPAITKFTVALSNMVTGQWYFLIAGDDRHRSSASASGRAPPGAARSGTRCACGSPARSA